MLAGTGLPDAASWCARPGRGVWQPEDAGGLAFPVTRAGVLRGGWRLDEPARAPAALPWPGVAQVRSPLAWYDSLACGGPGAADGWDAALAGATGHPVAGARTARSAFSLAGGSSALDETSVTLARGDSSFGFGLDVASGTRGARDGVERTGGHVWGGRAHLGRGRHRLSGTISQRGAAAKLEGGEEQAARGQSGSADWRWERDGVRWTVGLARGLDRHESFGGGLIASERVAQETRLSAGFGLARGARRLEWELAGSQGEVRRAGWGTASRRASSLWGVARAVTPAAGGRLVVAVGAGRHGGVDRFDVAPSAEFARPVRGLDAVVRIERVLTPVWADLAEGVEPFLQRAWVGSAGIAAGRSGAWRARLATQGGRVYDRALAERMPLEELWLRRGLAVAPGTYDFLLAEGGIERVGRRLDAGLEGFGLAHRSSRAPAGARPAPQADPDAGFRAWLGGRGRLFRGDLGLGLRAEAAGVGAREASSAATAPRRLPAYVTFSLVGEASIGDAAVVCRVDHLEDRAREGTWTDTATGLPVVVGRRSVQLRLVWRLFN